MKELMYEDNSEYKEGYVYREYRSDKPLDHNHNINAPEELELLVGKTITKAQYVSETPMPNAPPSDFWNKTKITKIIAKIIFSINKIFSMMPN